MALGGGTWLFQNKKLPGTYINFISKDRPMNGYCRPRLCGDGA